jgi:cell division septum initiation protein DivIVA
MAFPTAVNDQITDAVTQSGTQVLGDASAQAMSLLYQATAQAQGTAAANAVAQQQNAQTVAQAATTLAVATLLGDSKVAA